jgi:alginate O-acetyltransferase complex protein AlgI
MIFNSPLFLFLFLPFFFAVYFAASPRARRIVGLLGSLAFFSWGQAAYLPLMVALIVWNYGLALRLGKEEKRRQVFFWTGVVGNVTALVFYKFLAAFGTISFLPPSLLSILWKEGFPLGLSYIAFQAISYLVDVYRGVVPAERDWVNFSLYILLFPKILVGPISRYRRIASSLAEPTISSEEVAFGIRRFIGGLGKKVLIADTLAKTVNAVFRLGAASVQTPIAWMGLFAYALQIYFDFSGYTDMALGLGRMMGFRLEENFDFPYLSQSLGEFWRRWHISLSTWFRDYVFYPLERRRLPFFGQQINILIVFLLTGLWHGFTASFLLWGALHGFFLVLESLFWGRTLKKLFRPLRHLYALSAILLTWVVFRSPTPRFAWDFLRRLFGVFPTYTQPSFSHSSPLPFIEPSFLLACAAGLLFAFPILPALKSRFQKSFSDVPAALFAFRLAEDGALFLLLIASLAAMASGAFAPGIYGQF